MKSKYGGNEDEENNENSWRIINRDISSMKYGSNGNIENGVENNIENGAKNGENGSAALSWRK
jgi:hypothetical protein